MPSLKSTLFKSNIDERLSDAISVIEFARNYEPAGNGTEAITDKGGIAVMGYSPGDWWRSGRLQCMKKFSAAVRKKTVGELLNVIEKKPPVK